MLIRILLSLLFFLPAHAEIRILGSEQTIDPIITGDQRAQGSRLHFYLKNTGVDPIEVRDVSWLGRNLQEHSAAPDYQLIWWRGSPEVIPAGGEGVVTLVLRRALDENCEFTIQMSDDREVKFQLRLEQPGFRFGGIVFSEDLRSAVCYVEQMGNTDRPPREIWIDGQLLDGLQIRWLSGDYVGGVRPALVTPDEPFQRGQTYVFRLSDGKSVSGSSLRAFHGWTRFGTCGYHEFERFAAAGLNQYFSFAPMSLEQLDQLQELGMGVYANVPAKVELSSDTVGHPALTAWLVADEPDVHDYSADVTRPDSMRIGTLAPQMVEACREVARRDPLTPSAFTLNLTYVPANYCIYGMIPDLLMPDSYPITHGQPLTNFRDYAAMARRAAAPKPFTMVYQGCWEEWAKPQDVWQGRNALIEQGWEAFVDTTKMRGFGRAPVPAEITVQILYAVGNGSKGALSYTDATEVGQGWVFHGSLELPEIWEAIGRNSRMLRIVSPVIEMGFPISWAEANIPKLWVATLVSPENGALVVVVNEDYESNEAGFSLRTADEVKFQFADLPWMKARAVFRVGDGVLKQVAVRRLPGRIEWVEEKVNEGVVYLVLPAAELADAILVAFQEKAPMSTEVGRATAPESYLRGRRRTTLEEPGTAH